MIVSTDFTSTQKTKLRSLAKGKVDKVKIRFSKEQLQEDGSDMLKVSDEQMKKIVSAKTSKNPRGVDLEFTKSDLLHSQEGGFLPVFLAPLLPTIATALGSAVVSYGATKALDAIFGEGMEGDGLTQLGVKPKNTGEGLTQLGVKSGKGLTQLGKGDVKKKEPKAKKSKKKNTNFINNQIKKMLFPIHPLSNHSIDKYLQLIGLDNKFYKSSSKDLLPKRLENDRVMVINLDDMDGTGTHWVCIINSKDNKYVLYYDSFGIEYIDPKIFKFLKSSKKEILYNENQIQDISSVLCGYYCLKMIKDVMLNGFNYQEAINKYTIKPSNHNKDIADNLFMN